MRVKFFPIYVDNQRTITFALDDSVLRILHGQSAIFTKPHDDTYGSSISLYIEQFPWSKQYESIALSSLTTHCMNTTECILVESDSDHPQIYYAKLRNPWDSVSYDSTSGMICLSTKVEQFNEISAEEARERVLKRLEKSNHE